MCVVKGAMWNDFIMHNITCSDVAYIHFVEEGEDVFSVSCYSEYQEKFHYYEPESAQFWRCFVPVTDTSLSMQWLPENFLKYLNGPTPTEHLVDTTNTTEYTVEVESEYLYDRYVHSFLFGCGWERLVQDLNMKPGQWMVFTQVVLKEEYNVMLFERDGGSVTTVETYTTNIVMNALCHQAHDYGMFILINFNYMDYIISL